jgi:hypothetical protein
MRSAAELFLAEVKVTTDHLRDFPRLMLRAGLGNLNRTISGVSA